MGRPRSEEVEVGEAEERVKKLKAQRENEKPAQLHMVSRPRCPYRKLSSLSRRRHLTLVPPGDPNEISRTNQDKRKDSQIPQLEQ